MSQSEAILEHLTVRGTISAIEALQLYGCFRLAARINDLRAAGHNITTIITNVNGKKVAFYKLGASHA